MAQQSRATGELNFIVSYIFNGCRTPLQLFVTTAQPIAGEIALVFLTSDWQDIVTTFWRPKGLRSNRHGRKKRGKNKLGGFKSPLDLVGETIPSLHDPFFGTPTTATTFLWTLEGVIERVSWTVAVVEMTNDLVFKTLLGVLTLKATKCEVPGRAFAKGNEFTPLNNGQLYYLSCDETLYEEFPCEVSFGSVYFNDGNFYQLLADCVATNHGNTDGWFELEIWISSPDGGGVYRFPRTDLGPGGTQTVSFAAIAKGDGFIQWYQRSQGPINFPSYSLSASPSAFTT
jgi:hypothetical protein